MGSIYGTQYLTHFNNSENIFILFFLTQISTILWDEIHISEISR